MSAPLEIVRNYLATLESRSSDEDLIEFLHPDVIQEEFPNHLTPQGARRDFRSLLDASERGRMVVEDERYEIVQAMSLGSSVALEVKWSATLKIPVGTLEAGDVMRARLAIFIEMKDGRIYRQRNYDCFEAF